MSRVYGWRLGRRWGIDLWKTRETPLLCVSREIFNTLRASAPLLFRRLLHRLRQP